MMDKCTCRQETNLCEFCERTLRAELSQADFDRKAWKADCRRTQAALDFEMTRSAGLQAEIADRSDAEKHLMNDIDELNLLVKEAVFYMAVCPCGSVKGIPHEKGCKFSAYARGQ